MKQEQKNLLSQKYGNNSKKSESEAQVCATTPCKLMKIHIFFIFFASFHLDDDDGVLGEPTHTDGDAGL